MPPALEVRSLNHWTTMEVHNGKVIKGHMGCKAAKAGISRRMAGRKGVLLASRARQLEGLNV